MGSVSKILKLIIQGDSRGLKQALSGSLVDVRTWGQRAQSAFARVRQEVFSLRGAIGALGLGAFFRSVIRATTEQERVNRLLESQLRATGEAAGFNFEQMRRMAQQIQATTTFGDEYVQNLQAQLLAYRNISDEIFERTLKAILDFSTATGRDATTAVRTLGVAINDPINGMTRLRQAGIALDDDIQATIRTLAEQGRVAEAQSLLLDEMERSYGGAAIAARDTFGGALQALRNVFGDLLEGESGLRESTAEVEKLTGKLQDPATVAAFDSITGAIIRMTGALGDAIAKFIEFGESLGENLARAIHGPAEIEEQIESLQARLNVLNNELSRPRLLRANPFRSDGSLRREIAETETEIRNLQGLIDSLATGSPAATTAAADARPTIDPQQVAADAEAEEAARKRREAIEQIIQSLINERETTEETRDAIIRYRLEQIGATEADIERAQAIVAQIEAKEADAEATREQARLERERAEELARNRESDEAMIASLREEIRLMGLSNVEREQAIQLMRLSADATDEQREAVERLVTELHDLREAAKESQDEMSQFAIQGARDMQSAFADFLFDPFEQGLDGMLRGFLDVIRRMLAEAAAARILEALFPSDGGGGGLASLFGNFFQMHGGGIAGAGGSMALANPLAFVNAPRYHGGGVLGLGPDEVPIIGRRGEEMLTRDDPRHRFNGGGQGDIGVRIVNQIDGQAIADAMNSAAGEKVILNVISNNPGVIKRTIS